MLSRDPERPAFSETEVVRIVSELYGLQVSVEELVSERDQNFRVDTGSGDSFVLKIAAMSEKRETLELQNQTMTHLSVHMPEGSVPSVIKSVNGEEIETYPGRDGRPHFVRLLTYLPGRVIAHVSPHTDSLLYSLGQFIGSLSKALESFSHPESDRELYWDLKLAPLTIERYRSHIQSDEDRGFVEYYAGLFESEVLTRTNQLRRSVIHNDGNDYNLVVRDPHSPERRAFGILDFGDMVLSFTVFELAVTCAYALLHKQNPLEAAASVVAGYNSVYPLRESEIDVVFPAICARLAMSVAISSYQRSLEPESDYLVISQQPAYRALRELRSVHPRLATAIFRRACGLEPCKGSTSVVEWLDAHSHDFGPVLDVDWDPETFTHLDLSIGSLLVPTPESLESDAQFSQIVHEHLKATGARVAVGPYDEPRLIYTTDQYLKWGEHRTVHLGVDLFTEEGTSVLAPLDGVVHSIGDNRSSRDNGPTLVLEHNRDGAGPPFFTLYAHLDRSVLDGLSPGMFVKKGAVIAHVGKYPENGGWPPHLHFQIVVDMLDEEGDYPGVATPREREVWRSFCPDPTPVLQIPPELCRYSEVSEAEILAVRNEHIGWSLSISYDRPLKIVRGYMQYLYDNLGRKYLDAVNNVPHVGHSNPVVVKALQEQAAVLYTNTRYLHENLIRYAKRLIEKVPPPLKVCFFVNSGSEANELALRLARTHTGRRDIIVIDGAYHGNTGELINLSPYKCEGPGGRGLPDYVHKIRMPDPYRGDYKRDDKKAGSKYALDVKNAADEKVAAFICEPMMGCGGQIVFPEGYLCDAFKHVRGAGGVCIADEVQIGFGRVGSHFWGFETQGVVPDILALGKPIGNGHPLAAVITTPEIAQSFHNGMEFFSTTGGNPVSCAVGLAVLDEIESRGLQENALRVGTYLLSLLEGLKDKHSIIGDVRGTGLFIGVELVRDSETLEPADTEAHYIVNRMRDLGVLISVDGPLHNVLKIKPPLVFTRENAEMLVSRLDSVLREDRARSS